MKFRTEIKPSESAFKIKYEDHILSLGSCFSVEMAHKLANLKYTVMQNPAGITFNPASILNTIRSIKVDKSLPEEELIFNGECWCHEDFHGIFNHPDKSQVQLSIENSLKKAHVFIKNTKIVLITIGTAFVFENIETNKIVNNCHKLPGQKFRRRLLGLDEITEALNETILSINEMSNHHVNFILSLSPVRHLRDGFIENQKSKASCLLAIHKTVESMDNVFYFPSFEILMDELRDYRFYKQDMIHPTEQTTDYIFQKFENTCLLESEKNLRLRIDSVNRGLQHIGHHEASEKHKIFLKSLNEDIKDIEKMYPFIKF
jgi:hypothetical protein